MKNEFSTSWLSSRQPRKQRKYAFNAPLHLRHKFLSALLSKEIRKKYGKRSLPLRKGDEVLIMRGSFKKKKAKITIVDLKNSLVVLDGIQRTKKDGSKVNIRFHPSVLQIVTPNLDDKLRLEALNRKTSVTQSSAAPKVESKSAVAKPAKEKSAKGAN